MPGELILIAAVARNWAIGRGNRLPWHLPEDLRHFRELTRGHPVIMGRKTWESLPDSFRPLPGRRNLVISRNAAYSAPGGEVFSSLATVRRALATTDAFVIGGAQLYREALPSATRLELTELDLAVPDADAWFPAFSPSDWQETQRTSQVSEHGLAYAFVSYARIR